VTTEPRKPGDESRGKVFCFPRPGLGIRRILGALGVAFALWGCGPDGKSLGDIPQCSDQPLYRYVFDDDTKTWVRVSVADDGGAPVDQDAIAKAEVHCITPAGNATSMDVPASRDAGMD
jgi:hypothetical protein